MKKNGITAKKTEKKQLSPEKKKSIRRKYFFMFSFLALPTIEYLIFGVFNTFRSFFMAFQRPIYGAGDAYEWTLDNFRLIFSQFAESNGGVMLEAVRNTFIWFGLTNLVILPLSIFVCYFYYMNIPGKRIFQTVMYLPCIITGSALVVLFKYAIGYGGVLDALAEHLGRNYTYPIAGEPSAMITMMIYTVIFGFGGNMVLIGGAMNALNPELLDAAKIDGCSWIQELFYVILPGIWPTISTMLLLSFAGMLGASGPVLVFTQGDYGTMTLSFYLFKLVSGVGGSRDLNLACALGLLMSLVSIPVTFTVKRLTLDKEVS